ncbi:MAG: iron chelate uptake ABC transporter family permease subunit, partial [Myxococcota bacterium]
MSLVSEPRQRTAMVGVLGCFAAALALTPLIGAVPLAPSDVWNGIEPTSRIFWTLRLPRVLMAALVGSALAGAGVVFQALLRNDLATPFTLGVASGASLGAVLVIHLGLGGTLLGISPLPIAAFMGAVMVLVLVLGMVRVRG